MKVIKYNLCTAAEDKEILTSVILDWSEANEEIAKKEAHNGEYIIEDDGVEKTAIEQIAELKKQLSATDYQVIKCAECQLFGKEMPYDIAKLHIERQSIRDKINQLESGEHEFVIEDDAYQYSNI